MLLAREVFTPIQLKPKDIGLQVSVAGLYIISALIGQIFAIPPGNISPVWLPSGLMFALTLKLGTRIWPGIFLGAFFGNVWAYFSLDPILTGVFSIGAGAFNGFGDVLAIVLMAFFVQKIIRRRSPFLSLNHFFVFVALGGVIGPLISAVFGVTSLFMFGFLAIDNYVFSLMNWWIGDAVGVLLLAPFFFSILVRPKHIPHYFSFGLLLSIVVFTVVAADVFGLIGLSDFMYMMMILALPIAFALMLFSGQQAVYIVQLCVVTISIIATYRGFGPFHDFKFFTPLMALQIFIAVFSMIVFAIALLVEQKRVFLIELQEKKLELENLYRQDSLTGLWNRFRIQEQLNVDLQRFRRRKEVFAVLIIDIDDFKKVNDTYGHLEGDRVLLEFSNLLKENTRSADLVGRWGGEEFIVIVDQSDIEHIAHLGEKLVSVVAAHDFKLSGPMTISIGYTLCRDSDTIDSVIHRADEALYWAKSHGKNQAHYQE